MALMPFRRSLSLLQVLALLPLTVSLPTKADTADDKPLGRTAVARPTAEWGKDGKPVKIEFDFGDFKAWARRDGSWSAEGPIKHRGLLCGTYTLHLRVGQGNPGCSDVQWFREPRAVASVKLCNDATGLINGGNTEFQDAKQFDKITCAERTLSCSGNCK
jgi:hypothetical protein